MTHDATVNASEVGSASTSELRFGPTFDSISGPTFRPRKRSAKEDEKYVNAQYKKHSKIKF